MNKKSRKHTKLFALSTVTLEGEGISGRIDLTPIPPLTTYYNQAGLVEQNGTLYYFRMESIHGQISLTPLLANVQANEWYTLTLHRGGTALSGPLSITVTQESDPSKTATATQTISDMDWHFRHTIQAGMVYLDDYKEFSEDDSNVYVYGSKPHAVTSITSGGQTIRQYTYDLNGNMTQRIEGSDTYTFAYDAENRLMSGAKNGVTLASYTYDGDGKRVKVVEGGLTTYYIGDYYEWREGSTTTAVKYYYAAGQRIAMREGSTLTWLLGDHLGSTTISATENGTLASEQTYTAWGQTRSGSVGTDRQYTGQISEAQLGLYFFNARYFDGTLGRFISPDSFVPDKGNPQGLDRYAYVANNPISRVDASGHCWGIASYIRGLPTYNTTCNNLDMALTIVQSDKASAGARVLAGAYVTGEFVAHGAAAVYGGILACGLASAACYTALTAGPGILEAACHNGKCGDVLNTLGNSGDQYSASQNRLNTLRGLTSNGPGYEDWVVKNIGGIGEVQVGNYKFDNQLGNVLMEVKSFSWEGWAPTEPRYADFQNDIGRAYSNAVQSDHEFLLRMLNRPPQFVLDWLEKKGYDYVIETELWR